MTLAEKICEITRNHLENNNGMLLGQSITAVGWVNGTVPDCKNIVELPMTDVAGADFAVGAAMVGRRPIFVIRFQDFIMLNGNGIFNYAAKINELHGNSAPVFVRAVGSDGLGPVHSGIMHHMAMSFPGMLVCAPMTPCEYEEIWNAFMSDNKPMYVSEHRRSYGISEPMQDQTDPKAVITLYGISDARINMIEAAGLLRSEGIFVNLVHVNWLKPLMIGKLTEPLLLTGKGLVIDSGCEICGAAQSIAYELMINTGCPVYAMGVKDHTKCLREPLQNKTPSPVEIVDKVKKIIEMEKNNGQ